ncbi:uncharacterized protein LOC132757405 [Ruditapes philippinarum]|uniref:uncharacterized protein LOC132757405 n=1 Tax=Ruditapes philippinarum TaxID=129788 RepID=UPI00295A85CE|nr:uncharacterized protein LOC132757405 [Ruditapes philippinarum]
MDIYTARPKMRCRNLPHGMVLDSGNCQRDCTYLCFQPYKHADMIRHVNCDVISGQWVTTTGKTPCIKPDIVSTTKKYVGIDPNFRWNYDDIYKTMPTFKPIDFDIPNVDVPTTFKPIDFDIPNVEVPTLKPFNYDDFSDNSSSSTFDSTNSAAIPGLVVAGVFVLTIISVFIRYFAARSSYRVRHQRIRRLSEHVTPTTRTRAAGEQRMPVTPSQTRTEESRNESENDTTGVFIIVRRIFRIHQLRNPYSALENPPEPPPYDAESVPPPSYEETEGTNRPASDSTNEASTDVRFSESSETPVGSPPPYTENI